MASSTPPSWLGIPENRQQLSEVVQAAHQDHIPLLIAGSGSKLSWGSPVQNPGWAVSTQNLDAIIEHAVADLTVTVEAGIPFQSLQHHLAQSQQWWPVDPLYPEQATVGGIIATGDTGSLRHRYGSVRDLILGVTFVRADGQVAKAGGRVVKNVAGYDLMKLLTGSHGTLGILAEVTLRLYPRPTQRQRLQITGELEPLRDLYARIVGSSLPLLSLDIISSPQTPLGIQVEMQGSLLTLQRQELDTWASEMGLTWQEGDPNLFTHQLNQIVVNPIDRLLMKVRIPVCESMQKVDWIQRTCPGSHVQISGGLGRWWAPVSTSLETLKQARLQFIQAGGSLSLLEGPIHLKQIWDPWGIPGQTWGLMEKIRQAWDPEKRLNPGRYGQTRQI